MKGILKDVGNLLMWLGFFGSMIALIVSHNANPGSTPSHEELLWLGFAILFRLQVVGGR